MASTASRSSEKAEIITSNMNLKHYIDSTRRMKRKPAKPRHMKFSIDEEIQQNKKAMKKH